MLSGVSRRQLLPSPGLGIALPSLISCQLPVADHAQTFVPFYCTRKLLSALTSTLLSERVGHLFPAAHKNSAFTKTGCCLSTRIQKKETKCVWAGGVEEQDYACDLCTEKGHVCARLAQDGDDYVVKWFPLEASKRGDVSYQELAYWRVESG